MEDRFPWSLLGYPRPLKGVYTLPCFRQCSSRIPSSPAPHISKPTCSCFRVLSPMHAQTTRTCVLVTQALFCTAQTEAMCVTVVAESTLQYEAMQNNSLKCARANLQLRGIHLHLTRHALSTQQDTNGPRLQRHSFPASFTKLNIGTKSLRRFLQSSSISKQKALVQIKRNR